jgi:long-chain acyl-CoA synthetase
MERIWQKQYPPSVPHEINPDHYQSIVHLFEDSTRKYASRLAFANMGHTITYAELDQLSARFASFLQHELGLKPGEHIAIQMPNLLQYPVALFGAMRAGLVVVNTNPLYTPREMEHQFSDAQVKAVIILANFAHHLPSILPKTQIKAVVVTELGDMLPPLKRLLVNTVVKYIKKLVPPYKLPGAYSFTRAMEIGARKPYTRVEPKSNDTAVIQYTGGTTGVAKGAMLSHRNLVANCEQSSAWFLAKQHDSTTQDVIVTALPLYHIFAFTVNCLMVLRMGGHNVLITNPRDMTGFLKELAKTPFTIFSGVNTLYNGMMNHPLFGEVNFSKMRVCVAGGMALQRVVAERWHKATGVEIIEGFGMTETSPVTHGNPVEGGGGNRVGTIGVPISSTDAVILDDEGNEMPVGERGEICVRGPQIMKGYFNRPEETAKIMLPNGFLRTGDIAIMEADGYFRIVDRKKDMILVSGFNVYPNEVEDVIAMCPGVLEVAAIGIPDAKSGEAVKVFVVKKDQSLTEEAIRAFAKENLTGYKLPSYIEFRPDLPKSNVGKILRKPLRDAELKKFGMPPKDFIQHSPGDIV